MEQGRLAKPAVPRHLRRCTLCRTRALGDERHFVSDCPHFAHIRRQFRSLYQDADGTMQCFVWHKDQKAVCHCLAAILNLADDSSKDETGHGSSYFTWNSPDKPSWLSGRHYGSGTPPPPPTKTRPHKPMLAEWTSEILSLSLSLSRPVWQGCFNNNTSLYDGPVRAIQGDRE